MKGTSTPTYHHHALACEPELSTRAAVKRRGLAASTSMSTMRLVVPTRATSPAKSWPVQIDQPTGVVSSLSGDAAAMPTSPATATSLAMPTSDAAAVDAAAMRVASDCCDAPSAP